MPKRFLELVLPLALGLAQPVAAGYSHTANTESVGPLMVQVLNYASDGCWTNSEDAKARAEQMLVEAGYDVVSEGDVYLFTLKVDAERYPEANFCYGFYGVEIHRWLEHGGLEGYHKIGESLGYGVESGNFDANILEQIDRMIDEM